MQLVGSGRIVGLNMVYSKGFQAAPEGTALRMSWFSVLVGYMID